MRTHAMIRKPAPPPDLTPLLRVYGRSMLPLIPSGSIVAYVPAGPKQVALGDLVVLRSGERLYVHRVIGRKGVGTHARILQKGDNELPAHWVEPSDLVGRATAVSRGPTSIRLDLAPRSFRVLLLVGFLRLEASVVGSYGALRQSSRWLGWIRGPAVLVAALAWPFRALFLRACLSVYRRRAVEEGPAVRTLLLACLHRLRAPPSGGPEPLPEVRDWNAALEALGHHRLGPLALRAICEIGAPNAPPPHAVQVLKQLSQRAELRHTRALAVLAEVHQLFRGVYLPYAVLRGPCLYETLYRDLFPREYEDIDLLVGPRRLDEALKLLASIGYCPVRPRWTRRGPLPLTLGAADPDRPPLQLHGSLADRANLYRIDDADVILRTRPFETSGTTFLMLCPEDQFLYLCLRAARRGVLNARALDHGYPAEWYARRTTGNSLLSYLDLDLFLSRRLSDLSLSALVEKARTWNVMAPILESMRVLRRLDPSSPADVVLGKLGYFGEEPADDATRHSSLLDRAIRASPARFRGFARLLRRWRLLFPPAHALRDFCGVPGGAALARRRLTHPFHMARKLLGAKV